MSPEIITLARRLVAGGRYDEALGLYDAYLAAHDEDDEIRLEMGLARLLSGDVEGFHRTGAEYVPCMTPEVLCLVGQRTRNLWQEYVRAGVRVAGTALIGASVALSAGCKEKPEPAKPPVEVVEEKPPEPPPAKEDAAAAEEEPTQIEVASSETPDASTKPEKKPPKKPPMDRPKNRYVAVHFDDSPEKF